MIAVEVASRDILKCKEEKEGASTFKDSRRVESMFR
jgi:hypothetical protein